MSKIKLATVRVNSKENIVQIKMNRGPNHTLKGGQAIAFQKMRDCYVQDNNSIPDANVLTANDFLEGRLPNAS